MKKFFSYEGWYYQTFSFITNIILINLLFLLTAGTIILCGPGLIALYRTIYRLYREQDISVIRIFVKELKGNLKRGFYLVGIVVTWSTLVGLGVMILFELAIQLGLLAIILFSLATLYLAVFVLLYSILTLDIRQTLKETNYVVLSSIANAIILFVIPALVFLLCNKINLFLFFSLGIALAALLQVMFFAKVLEVEDE